MRLTIEMTNVETESGVELLKVTVEVPPDDLTIEQVLEQLVRPALLAIGYSDKTLDEALGEEGLRDIYAGTNHAN